MARRSKETTPAANKSLTSRIVSTALGNLAPPLAAIVTVPIMAQSLGVFGRGEVAAVTAPFLLAIAAASFGLPEAVIYWVAKHPTERGRAARRAFPLVLVTGAIVSGLIALLADPLSGGDERLAHMISLSALVLVPALLVGLLRGIASGLHQWGMVARERFTTSVGRLIALAGLALTSHLTVETAVAVIVLSPLLGAISYVALLARRPEDRDNLTTGDVLDRAVTYSSLVGYGSRVWIGSISGVLLSRLDQTLMTPLSGVEQLGFYAVAVSIGELPLIVNGAVRDVMLSADASRQDDRLLTAAARLSSTVCAVIAAVIGLSMPWWVPVVLGDGFEPAISVAALLLVAVVIGTPGSVAGAALSARGRPGLRSTSLVVACLINVGLVVALVPSMGAMGAAAATLVGNIVSSNMNIIFLRRKFGVSPVAFYGIRRSDAAVLKRVAVKFDLRSKRDG